ncbi:MAG TPA: fumarylacetoacetate hydrolase family protein [Bryobacteraceae bacterium]|nr:fumarylacetoacetate hydrolase family protein [Bryobacteraceae bacterium]
MKLCTFEVATHLGRYSRVGAYKDGRIIDLNFATAWHMAQQGESEPQQLADALVPASMPSFLRAGLRATHTAEELFEVNGPRPAEWWRQDPPPRGPNDETLVYQPEQVRLRAPLPNPTRLGTEDEVRSEEKLGCELKMAAVIGKQGIAIKAIEARQYIAGFTGMNDFSGRYVALGPCLVTPDEIGNPYNLEITARVNGEAFGRTTSASLRPKFEQRIESLSANDAVLPGDIVAFKLDLAPKLKNGDVVELEIEKIGVLRSRMI